MGMKRKLIIISIAWLLLFAAAYAIDIKAVKTLSNRGIASVTDIISDIIPTPTPTGSTGGGGEGMGGAGVSTLENLDNIIKAETYKAHLITDILTTYNFLEPRFSIYEISVIGQGNETDVALRTELLKDVSTSVNKSAPDMVYKYQNAWIGSDEIKDIAIKFRVENSWITDNNIPDTNIAMFRWNKDNKDWAKLDTSIINKDSIYTYFESKPEGLSQFAIVGLKEITAKEDDIPTPIVTISTNEATQGEIPEDIPIDTPKSNSTSIIMTLMIVSIIYLFVKRRG